jgi:hypothetical protein
MTKSVDDRTQFLARFGEMIARTVLSVLSPDHTVVLQ